MTSHLDSLLDPYADGAQAGVIAALAERLRTGATTSTALTTAALGRVEAHNPQLNAVVTVLADAALAAAGEADDELRAGHWRGPLHGIPVGVKDIIDTAGVLTTVGSEFFRERVPAEDAEVVRRLRAAGAVMIGKTQTHEFAYGPTGDTSWFGPVRNPHDPERIAGGSSGGSAVAVATGMCLAALGSDTGGSIRIPAALCGVVGMKPTFGRVSRHGVFPLSATLDHVGPLTRTVADNALVLRALCGFDRRDPGSVSRDDEEFTAGLDIGVLGLTIGVADSHYFDNLDGEVDRKVRAAIASWEDLGAAAKPVTIPTMDEILQAHRTVVAVEAYTTHRERLTRQPDLYGATVRQRLVDGAAVPAWEYAEALQVRARGIPAFAAALADVDVLVTPTLPVTAQRLGQTDTTAAGLDETVRSALTRLPGPTNLLGLPSLSVPCGLSATGLPIGVQLIGPAWSEALLYRVGYALECHLADTSD